jgi:hypothetical protein
MCKRTQQRTKCSRISSIRAGDALALGCKIRIDKLLNQKIDYLLAGLKTKKTKLRGL